MQAAMIAKVSSLHHYEGERCVLDLRNHCYPEKKENKTGQIKHRGWSHWGAPTYITPTLETNCSLAQIN